MSAYLRLLATFTAILAAALAGFNAIVDPYGQFDPPKIAGVNQSALGFNHRLQLAKALAVSRIRPASIILGNSRAEAGYDPQHPGLVERPAYNLAIGGSGLSMVHRYFLEALAAGGLRHAVVALDLTMFEPAAQEAGLDAVLLTDASGKLVAGGREWRRLAFILLSGTASSDSWWSLTHQDKPVAIYQPSGLREEAYDIDQVRREGGARRASLRVEASFLTGTLRDVASADFRASYAATLAQLREIIARAAERNVRLTLIINPIHARQSYMLAAAGLWRVYEEWKRNLATAAMQSSRSELVALWDFSGISPCTAESMPAIGDAASSMRWYRESSHFRRALGDRVFDRVFARADDGACPGLGSQLAPLTLDATLAEQRAALAHWETSHPADVAEIDALARRYGRVRPSQ